MSSMISHAHKWVFIHVPKTGGSSITQALLDLFEYGPPKETHLALWDLCPKPYDYFKFMVIRNPWAQCMSWVTWHLKHGDVKTIDQAAMKVEPPSYFGLNMMDYVLRFERLADDFAVLCDKLGIERRELQRFNESPAVDYREHFTRFARWVVAERFRREIEAFRYDFESPEVVT